MNVEPPPVATAVLVRKKQQPVAVRFALFPGRMATREGEVRYEAGAALMHAGAGDRWPVERTKFDAAYEPVGGTRAGQDGHYVKRPMGVLAWRLTEPASIAVGHAGDRLHGEPGDWLLQYGPGDFGIVGDTIFAQTYEVLGPGPDPVAPAGGRG
jgi:hypothetical protein